jgi:hypothetical protein
MPYPGQQLGIQNLIDRETRKVGKGGGTENGPAILPIANSFEIFCLTSAGMSATLFKVFEVIGDLGPE